MNFLGLRLGLLISLFLLSQVVSAESSRPPECGGSTSTFTNDTDFVITSAAPPQVITSTINVSGVAPFIWDVDVATFITHTFPADLDITLTSPAGTVVTITSDNAGTNDNVFNGTVALQRKADKGLNEIRYGLNF